MSSSSLPGGGTSFRGHSPDRILLPDCGAQEGRHEGLAAPRAWSAASPSHPQLAFHLFPECIGLFLSLLLLISAFVIRKPSTVVLEGHELTSPCILTQGASSCKYLLSSYFASLEYHALAFPARNGLEAWRILISIWAKPKSKDGTTLHGCCDAFGSLFVRSIMNDFL